MNISDTLDDSIEFKGIRLIAGESSLNFLNTIKYRGKANNGDRFTELSDIIKWTHVAEIINDAEYNLLAQKSRCPSDIRLFKEICKFREQTRIIFKHRESDSEISIKALEYVEQAVSQLRPIIIINRETGVLEKSYPIDQATDLKFRIVACVDDLLQKRGVLTIKTCSGDDCDWLFTDVTKAKRRKWCDTRTCGNLSRVRRYRGSK